MDLLEKYNLLIYTLERCQERGLTGEEAGRYLAHSLPREELQFLSSIIISCGGESEKILKDQLSNAGWRF